MQVNKRRKQNICSNWLKQLLFQTKRPLMIQTYHTDDNSSRILRDGDDDDDDDDNRYSLFLCEGQLCKCS